MVSEQVSLLRSCSLTMSRQGVYTSTVRLLRLVGKTPGLKAVPPSHAHSSFVCLGLVRYLPALLLTKQVILSGVHLRILNKALLPLQQRLCMRLGVDELCRVIEARALREESVYCGVPLLCVQAIHDAPASQEDICTAE